MTELETRAAIMMAIAGDQTFRDLLAALGITNEATQIAVATTAEGAVTRFLGSQAMKCRHASIIESPELRGYSVPLGSLRIPYSSPEARTRAAEMIERGRQAVHAHPARREQAPDFPSIDELLFNIGTNREKLRVEIEAAHRLLPEAIAPRRQGETDERSIAARLRIFLETIVKRAPGLMAAETTGETA